VSGIFNEVPLVDSILRALARPRIAELPVDFSRLPAYRAEYCPDSGPKPRLDRDGWSQQIEALPLPKRLHSAVNGPKLGMSSCPS
jgi:hypothetical protein